MRSNILITAGPTREKIDPVRFISNYSTGTFGYEIAREAKRRDHNVVLISGPTCLKSPSGVKSVSVESALEMRREVLSHLPKADCVIMAAAVSDWRTKMPSKKKLKRHAGSKTLDLVENPDILKEVRKKTEAVVVGFALETEHLEKNAMKKLKSKGLDIIVANRLNRKSSVFGDEKTGILIMDKLGNKKKLIGKSKKELAKIVLDKALNFGI